MKNQKIYGSKSFFKHSLLMLCALCVGMWSGQAFGADSTCVRAQSGTSDFKGEANILFFYFGDDELTTLAQETTDLSLAFKGADYKVLLMDENQSVGTKYLKSKALNQADEILAPTEDNFLQTLRDVADMGYVLNIWIFAHGGSYTDSAGEEIGYFVAQDGSISTKDLNRDFGEGCDLPIRMVYSMTCYHEAMNAAWVASGAKASMGARYINFYPNQYTRFAKDWYNGKSFSTALNNSNTSSSRAVVHAYLEILSWQYSLEGDCGLIPNVLGETDCAAWFFTGGGPYDLHEHYNESQSGKWNMNNASSKRTSGDKAITRRTRLSWDI